jgi:hypothetical protein
MKTYITVAANEMSLIEEICYQLQAAGFADIDRSLPHYLEADNVQQSLTFCVQNAAEYRCVQAVVQDFGGEICETAGNPLTLLLQADHRQRHALTLPDERQSLLRFQRPRFQRQVA